MQILLFILILLYPLNAISKDEVNICWFGADGDYPELEEQKSYINQRLKDYNCKKGDFIDYNMIDLNRHSNHWPSTYMNSLCDFNYAITHGSYTDTWEDGYTSEVAYFSCIYLGYHRNKQLR